MTQNFSSEEYCDMANAMINYEPKCNPVIYEPKVTSIYLIYIACICLNMHASMLLSGSEGFTN